MVGLCRIFPFEINLSFERIGIGCLCPSPDNGVDIEQCLVVIFHIQAAYCTVHPEARYCRVQLDGLAVIGYGIAVFFLTDARNSPDVKYLLYIRVQFYGARGVGFSANVVV